MILFGGYTGWIEPGKLQAARLRQTLEQQQGEQAQLLAQVQALAAENKDPDAARRVQLQQLREQLIALDRDIKQFDRSLVAPSQAPALLQTLLARHRGLTLPTATPSCGLSALTPPGSEGRPLRLGAAMAAALA